MSITVQDILTSAGLREALEAGLDFRLLDEGDMADDWFRVDAPERFVTVAHQGAGGVFLLGQSSGAMLYISSEGQAGIVAASLEEFLGLGATHPYWQDLLKFSGGGKLAEMHRCVELLKADAPDLLLDVEESVRLLRRMMTLPSSEAAVALLHRAVADLGLLVRVTSPEGDAYDGLFNNFTGDHLLRYAQPRSA
ncbi:hypothetical protein [Variovorax saccharolyticus]|uniref:hypothetical protein n=1 Tax=Variovorax saccharolyticus TaxID=3053516 RepID=UPI0025769E5B|nr:hypothetical protein [Variovorax sp. J22R187]MDM0018018.1 hypothetical protein [Variovorax sp. J22R187]